MVRFKIRFDCLVICLILMQLNGHQCFFRITKMGCNTSGASTIKLLCRVRSISRTTQVFNVGFELTKTIGNIKMNFYSFFKPPTGVYWRQIITFKNISMCPLFGGKESSIPLVSFFMNQLRQNGWLEFVPNGKGCPLTPAKIYGYNMTWKGYDPQDLNRMFITPVGLPNGVYRNVFGFVSEVDPVGTMYWLHVETYERDNAENIMK